jgi:mono/diheme cytochrome c family protein
MPDPIITPMSDNIDYSPTSNVARLHAAAAREAAEPVAKPTPVTLPTVVGIMAFCIVAGSYFGANGGTTLGMANVKGYAYKPEPPPGVVAGTGELSPLEQHKPENWKAFGKAVYGNTCVSCHGANGEGTPGKPHLKNSEFVIKGERRLVAILLHGITGSLSVDGKPFNDTMNPFGSTTLSEKQLAQVLSYIRTEWGNNASIIYEDQIKALKKELGSRSFYNEAELRQLPEGANAPPSEWTEKLKGPAPGAAPAPGTPAAAPGTAAPAPAPVTPPAK